MEILGHTLNGRIIVAISKSEWDRLREGQKPQDDFESTEARKFIRSVSLPYWGNMGIYKLYEDRKFDGTLDDLEKAISDERNRLRNVGPVIRNRIRQAIAEYRESNNVPPATS